VKDNIAPMAVCTDVTVALGANGSVNVPTTPLAFTSTDNCFVSTFVPTNQLYTAANLGVNSLTINVKDQSGNSTPCISQVTVMPFVLAKPEDVAERNLPGEAPSPKVSIYPNPTTGDVLTLNLKGFAGVGGSVEIRDFMGQLRFSKRFDAFLEEAIEVDLGGIPTGTHILLVKAEGMEVVAQRFVVARN
jgi:hypothetical protein